MDHKDLLLRDFSPRSTLVTEDHMPQQARFATVDVHNHFGRWRWDGAIHRQELDAPWSIPDIPAALDLMDEANISCAVNLDGGWDETLRQNLGRYKESHPDRFCVFASVDWSQVDEPGFGDCWAKKLEAAVAAGAQGLKVFKSLGLKYRDSAGRLVRPDDPRLDVVWEAAGELGVPVLIHTADPVAFFWPLDEHNERWDELSEHPDWHFYGSDYPAFIDLIQMQLRVVERHPRTNFISAHVLSYSENLRFVAQALDRYPNLYVDFSERVGELGRQPYSARRFFIRYADRILFGTDSFRPNLAMYRLYFRFLETADEHFDYLRNQGRWRVYGIFLPDDVLRKVYYENAHRLIHGLA